MTAETTTEGMFPLFPKRCANCDRGPEDVKRLVSGLGVYLCGSCAAEMAAGLHPDEAIPAEIAAAGRDAVCSFCGKRRDQVAFLAVGKACDFLVCDGCLALVMDIVADAG